MRRVCNASRGPTTTRLRLTIEPDDKQRLAGRNAQPFALTDGEVNDAGMPAEHPALKVDNVARLRRAGLEPLDDVAVAAEGTKQMSWLSCLSATASPN